VTIPPEQQATAALLRQLTGGGAPVETHISAVFIGADRVLKLKKAVTLSFLDFSSPSARERFCRRELAINAAAAPGLYRAVHSVTRDDAGALRLGGAGPAVDWVLEMAPLPAGDFLDRLAARGALDTRLLDALGDAVAALHAALPPVAGWDSPAALLRVLHGNAEAAHAAGLPSDRIRNWSRQALSWLDQLGPVLAARAAEGRVRRCHGDLHLGNLVLWQGRPVTFDALEFDEAMATIDTGYDLAFLLADLELRLGRPAANRVLNRYLARSGDAGLVAGLPLWLSLRCLIRAHCLGRAGQDGLPLPYLDAAEAALHPAPPRLVAVGGLPGSGKSHLARQLAPGLGASPGALLLRSDEIRKRQHGVAPEVRLPPSAYAPEASAAVQAELLAQAAEALRGGHAVIADATFLDPAFRQAVEALAGACPFQGLWLEAPLPVLQARVAGRSGDASDAGLAILEQAARTDPGPIAWPRLDAGGDALAEARRLLDQGLSRKNLAGI
jgi:aminoglycoside phosphotransferase family enzyme/predicted kinase